ncbi:MAG: hypothetical protein GY863_22410 [bacterium]|nr:hypothetical protein [bacterium]
MAFSASTIYNLSSQILILSQWCINVEFNSSVLVSSKDFTLSREPALAASWISAPLMFVEMLIMIDKIRNLKTNDLMKIYL